MTGEHDEYHAWQDERAKVRLENSALRGDRDALKAEVERLRAVSDELQAWRDRAVASCIKRECDLRDRRARELEAEVERLTAELETARSIGASPTARFVREARALHLYREDMDRGDVEAMAGEYVAMAMAVERLRAAAPIIHTLDVEGYLAERASSFLAVSPSEMAKLVAEARAVIRKHTRVVDVDEVADAICNAMGARYAEKSWAPLGWSAMMRKGREAWTDLARAAIEAIGAQEAQPETRTVRGEVYTFDELVTVCEVLYAERRLTVTAPRVRLPSIGIYRDSTDDRWVGYRAAIKDCDRAIRAQGFEVGVLTAEALPDNADPGDEAQPASPTDEGLIEAMRYGPLHEPARAARALLNPRFWDAVTASWNHERHEKALLARTAELEKALECMISVVGLTAFKYEAQRAVLQEAVDLATRALRADGTKKEQG